MAVTERVTEVWTGSSTERKVDLKTEEKKRRRKKGCKPVKITTKGR